MPAVERTPTMRWQAVAWRWLGGVRGWWPDRNPLRRRCDRAEAALVTVLVAVFLAGAPLLALAAGWLRAADRAPDMPGWPAGISFPRSCAPPLSNGSPRPRRRPGPGGPPRA